jgi:KDO2-lipid IV(A) lauroyltransferase
MTVTPLSGSGAAGADTSRPTWYTHPFNHAAIYRLVTLAAGALPRALRLRAAAAAARGLAAWFPRERAVVRANVARILPRASAAAREALVADVFRHFAMAFVDLLTTNRREPDPERLLARVEGEQALKAPAARGRGLVVLTAHLGNWELAGRLLARRVGRPTHVVVAAEADPRMERLLRGPAGPVRFVVRDDPTAALPLVAALRRDEIVALQGDRALGNRGDVSVPFFGAPAKFPLGPFVLARATGAPVVPAFCVMNGGGRYAITVGTPMHVGVDGERPALAHWVDVLEGMVRRHPEQWFNFFDPWSEPRGR